MKVFVTGGTGFLGREVVKALLSRGHSVRALVRSKMARLPEGAESVVVDLFDVDALAAALAGTDAVIHLAGKVSRDPQDASSMHKVHVLGTKCLLDAMATKGIETLVLASTSGTIAVSAHAGRIATESDEAAIEVIGRWPYYMSKRLQEQEVLARNKAGRVRAVVLNPTLLLGPNDERLSSTGDVLKILHKRLPALTDGTIAFVDVRDCAPAFVTALERLVQGHGAGERYLLNGANLSVRAFTERVARAGDVGMPKLKLSDRWANLSAKVIEGVYQAVDRVPPIDAVSVDMGCHHWGASWDKAARELGFTPRDPLTTLRDTVKDLERRGLFRRSP